MDLREGATLTFEVLEDDCSSLKTLGGKVEQCALDSRPFCGQVLSLEPCDPVTPALSLLGKPTMRGVMRIQGLLTQGGNNRQN